VDTPLLEDEPTAPSPQTLVAFLESEPARAALAMLALRDTGNAQTLTLVEELRRDWAPWQVAALVGQARLRKRAAAKWPFANELLLVEEALEQATAWPVALLRAQRMGALAPPGRLLDLGCGIGGDTLALATERPVLAFERDPVRAALARANLQRVGMGGHGVPGLHAVEVHAGDWTTVLAGSGATAWLDVAAVFADPARRTTDGAGGSRRTFSLQGMQPPIDALLPLTAHVPLLVVKVAPGVQEAELPPETAVQFVSHEGTAKEGVLWLGAVAASLPRRWASVFADGSWHELVAGGASAPALADDVLPQPGQWLWEPDAAVLRAGALDTLCARLAGRLFAPDIAYVVGDAPAADLTQLLPFATPFRLLEVAPFSLKQLNRRLAALGVGTVELKKRGFPLEPESLRPRLKLQRGGRSLTVLLTRRGKAHWMLLAERTAARSQPQRTGAGEEYVESP
jgi:hypothetical protein